MTDHEKRLILRGMSVARGLLMGGARCEHHGLIRDYQKALGDAWGIDEGAALHRAEFEQLVEEINEAIEARHPDWISHNGPRARRH